MGIGRKSATSLADGFNQVGAAAMGLGTAMMASGAVVVGAMGAAAVAAADFQSQLTLLMTHAGASEDRMKTLGAWILDTAGKLGFDPNSLAQAAYHVQSVMTSLPQNLRTVQQEEALVYASAQLAAIGHADLEDSVNAVAKAFVVYGKDGLSATDITAIFNKTVGEGNMRLQELNTAFAGGLLPVAEQAGIKLQSVGAALATMTDEGIPAARAAIYLRSAIIQLTVPSAGAVQALEAVGVAGNDAKSQVDSFSKVLINAGVNQTDVSKKLQQTGSLGDTLVWLREKIEKTGLSTKDTAALLDKAFGGIRSGTGVVTLYNNLDGLIEKERDANNATKEWSTQWDKFTQSDPTFQIHQLEASWHTLIIILGDAFLPVMLKVLAAVTPMVEKIGQWITKNSDLVASAGQGLAIFLLVGGAILFVAGVIGRIIGFIIPIVEFFIELGAAFEAVTLGAEATGAAVGTTGGVIASAFGGPITIAIAVILALIAVGVLLVTHWNEVKAVAMMVWGWIAPYVMQAVNFIRSVIQVEIGAILAIWRQHHAQIMAVAQVAWNVIKVLFLGALLSVVITIALWITVFATVVVAVIGLAVAIFFLAGKFMDLVGVISKFVGEAWSALVKFFADLIGLVIAVWQSFAAHPAYWLGYLVGLIVAWSENISVKVTDFFVWLVTTAAREWNNFVNTATSIISRLPGQLWNIFVNAGNAFNNFINWMVTTAWNEAPKVAQAIINAMINLPNTLYSIGRDIVMGLWNGIKSLTGWLHDQAASFASGVVDGMKAAIRGGSPSMLAAEEIGQPISQGIAYGLKADMPKTQALMNTMVYNLTANGAPNTSAQGTGRPLTIENHSHTYLDGRMIATQVEKITDQRLSYLLGRA